MYCMQASTDNLTLNNVLATYNHIYGSLDTDNDPLETVSSDKDDFVPSIPVVIDRKRFTSSMKESKKSSPGNQHSRVSVGNWTLEDLWTEKGIPFSTGFTPVPDLQPSKGANEDPILTPEELQAFGLAPISYDYLFQATEQPVIPPPPRSSPYPPIHQVISQIKAMNSSYFENFAVPDSCAERTRQVCISSARFRMDKSAGYLARKNTRMKKA